MARSRRDDDDDDDDRPRRKRRFRDDDDDDHDPKRKPNTGGISPLMLAGGTACVLFLIGGIGVLVVMMLGGDDKPAPDDGPNPPVAAANPDKAPPRPGPDPNRPFPAVPFPAVPLPGANPRPQPRPQPRPPVATAWAVPVPVIAPQVNYLVFAGGPDGHTGIVSLNLREGGYEISVVKTPTGRAVGTTVKVGISDTGFAVSPDGKWAAVVGSAPGAGNPVSVYEVATGKEAKAFTPYPRGGGAGLRAPQLQWVSFVGPDRLLTINEASGFDVWTVPGGERVGGQPGRQGYAGPLLAVNGFTHTPTNFALTPDGKTLALFNGAGFSIIDTATGKETARTPPFMKDRSPANFFATAFSPDGARLACFCKTYMPDKFDGILVWDAKTGKRLTAVSPKGVSSASGFAWWGGDHLTLWQGGIASADVLELRSGEVVGKVKFAKTGKVATVPPDGQLWGTAGGVLFDPVTGATVLFHHPAPKSIRPGTTFEIDDTGRLTTKP